jgi:hypothetical protein
VRLLRPGARACAADARRSSPLLSWQTYTACTALSLFKLIIHTSIGSTIHSFSRHYLAPPDGAAPGGNGTAPGAPAPPADDGQSTLGTVSTVVGIVLCVAIFVYLSFVARRAVDDELGAEHAADADADDERVPFIAADGGAPGAALARVSMAQSPFALALDVRARASIDAARYGPRESGSGSEEELMLERAHGDV